MSHALQRLHDRFGLTEATADHVQSAAVRCAARRGTELLRSDANGREWHRLLVLGVPVVALYSRASAKVITFLETAAPLPNELRRGRTAKGPRLDTLRQDARHERRRSRQELRSFRGEGSAA